MDPVSAVSIAAAVVQFADFGFRLLKSAHELYKSPSGQKSEHVELSQVSKDLSRLAHDIGAKLAENKESAGDIFLRLHDECMSTNEELQSMLSKLKVRGSEDSTRVALAADGLKVALKQITAAGDIEKLANRLDKIRQQMNVALLYMLLDAAGKNGMELRQLARQQSDMMAALDRIDDTTKRFSTGITELIDKWPKNHRAEADEMVRYVLSDEWDASEYAKRTVLVKDRDDEKLEKICQSLYFESISHRETSIPKRHAATFEWIFREPQTSEDGHALWSSFSFWLQGQSPDIYWITGKPGAGKSTLVKFISQDSRFKALLQEWAAGSQLLIVRFFSWTPGADRLQKSQQGLFRTLLLEAIKQRPQLAIDIFPARWFLLQSFNRNIKLPDLTMDELKAGFQNLLSATGDELKLVLLIDGLDEFDEDHHDLVRLLRDANTETGVKICASSRPWNIFRDEYSNNPRLQLENFTRQDMKLFIEEQLQLSPGYSDFAATNPEAAGQIATGIVNKSQGVFLWVSVISGLLEDAFQQGASISELKATIGELPGEVADLFRYIWDRTSQRFRANASQYFQIMRACQQHRTTLFALTLWFGHDEISLDTASVTKPYLTSVISLLERRLMSRTGGLLELVYGDNNDARDPEDVRVDYMHRTANDWVRDNWASIISATDPGFDPSFWFVKGEALNVVVARHNNPTLDIRESTTRYEPAPVSISGSPLVRHSTRLFELRCRAVFMFASHVSRDHPAREMLVTALDRLVAHMDANLRRGSLRSSDTNHWASFTNELDNGAEGYWNDLYSDLVSRIGSQIKSCNNFLELSARIPIPAYLHHRVQKNPDLPSNAGDGILNNVIFGELWIPNAQARLDILELLIREEYRLRPEWLCVARTNAEHAMLVLSNHSASASTVVFFTKVVRMLSNDELRIPLGVSQAGRSGASNRDGIDRKASVGLQNKTSKPVLVDDKEPSLKLVSKLRDSCRTMFGRK